MAENKTKVTEQSVDAYLRAIPDESRRRDCEQLVRLMARATKEPARMWGPSIVGFGSYHYRYESGREGDSCLVGFAARKGDISLYLAADFPGAEELRAKLGKHRMAKACLYVRTLGDIDLELLEKLVAAAAAATKARN